MKHSTLHVWQYLLFTLCCAIFLSACSRKMTFAASSVVPAASGWVKYKRDNNGNYAVQVKVRNLAPSTSLAPPRDAYVVWVETDANGIKNLGRINSSSGLLSKRLKATLDAVTPYRPRSFFISAENDAQISYPGPEVVLRAR